jgi:hypothetical protein
MKKKSSASHEMIRLNRAAFRIGGEAARSGRLELLLEETLAQVFGGDGFDTTTCTEFNCNVYAPPPPPQG